jgi:hypothetical protein
MATWDSAEVARNQILVPSRDGSRMLVTFPKERRVELSPLINGIKGKAWLLPEGSQVLGAAALEDGAFVWSQAGPWEGLVRVEPDGTRKDFPIPEDKVGSRTPAAVAVGPGGDIWFTQRSVGRLGRLTPHGDIVEYPLPSGYRAEEIVAGHDGRMYFTIKGKPVIGAVVAQPLVRAEGAAPRSEPSTESKAGAAGAGSGWEVAPYKPKPVRSKALTRAERMARYEECLKRAEERYQALQEEYERAAQIEALRVKTYRKAKSHAGGDAKERKAQGKGDSFSWVPAPSPAGVAFSPAGKDAAEGASGLSVEEHLAEMNVFIGSKALNHILTRHGEGGETESQFAREYKSREGMRGLIAQGLKTCGTLGMELSSSVTGRIVTRCEVKGAGFIGNEATSHFLVVSARYFNGEEYEYDVITAYPVW